MNVLHPSRFTGKERDAESGNDYFDARYYSSAMGRFLSPDWSAKVEPVPYAKLDNPQSLNLYSYVLNNPLRVVDPDGHQIDCSGDKGQGVGCQAIATWNNAHDVDAKTWQKTGFNPLTDKDGNVVHGPSGNAALLPKGFDVNAVLEAGHADKELRGSAPMVGAKATSEDLAKFATGGQWDLQRLSGKFDSQYIDSATILIGMFAQAAGITRDQILKIQDDFAAVAHLIHGYPKNTPMNSTYTHLPQRNVDNTDIGMQLEQWDEINPNR